MHDSETRWVDILQETKNTGKDLATNNVIHDLFLEVSKLEKKAGV